MIDFRRVASQRRLLRPERLPHAALVDALRDTTQSPFLHLDSRHRDDSVNSTGNSQVEIRRPTDLANQIIAAAEVVRSGGRTWPQPTGLAAEIVAAGAKRRQLGR